MHVVLIRRSFSPGTTRRSSLRRVLATATLLLAGLASAGTSYRVRPGDNLTTIARRAGVSVSTIRAVNPRLRNADHVEAGQKLLIPSRRVPGGTHRVVRGENLTIIARAHGLTLAALLRANPGLSVRRPLHAGAAVRIPGRVAAARLPGTGRSTAAPARPSQGATVRTASIRVSPVTPTGRGWLWPLPGHRAISSDFGPRVLDGEHEMHYGVDIVAPHGTAVRAARAGRVLEARADFERGWGWTVVLEHEGGWITRYAHLSATLVRAGEPVVAGQPVGRVGNTGRSTGTHLHFGTYLRWDPKDPLTLYE